MFNTTIWRTPVQFKRVLKVSSVKTLSHNHRRICTGLDCFWQQILAIKTNISSHVEGKQSFPLLTQNKTEVLVPFLLPSVQKSVTNVSIYFLYPGIANGRAFDNCSVHISIGVIQNAKKIPVTPQSHKHSVCRQVTLPDLVHCFSPEADVTQMILCSFNTVWKMCL